MSVSAWIGALGIVVLGEAALVALDAPPIAFVSLLVIVASWCVRALATDR